ncbi:DUF6894 family protein [Sphingomonas glaciei]|uniref:DUF6894 domain-containing protein n=1 Tax=Sphingomonas glaciei TaxID=2938948 RepID=A0ABY5MU04_9SPHN|nr:hypothetical protein [Sphingomonas glaciei]UUR07200.1 hypothetical protein M1K48_09615 [Sphingomonas glaciei]
MSRYHFHLSSGHETRDEEGTDLDSLQEARCYAVRMIAEVLCTSPERYWDSDCYRITVADDTGLTLFMVEMNSIDAAALGPKG